MKIYGIGTDIANINRIKKSVKVVSEILSDATFFSSMATIFCGLPLFRGINLV